MPPQHKEKLSATARRPSRAFGALTLVAAATLGIGGIGSGEAGAIALGQVRIYETPHGTPHTCTGTAIAPGWVLTAAHCVEGPISAPDVTPDVLKVHFSNNKSNLGPSIDVDRFEKAPKADIALLHLETPKKLKKYSKVADGHRNGDWIRDTAGVSTRPKRIEPQTESVWGSPLVELRGHVSNFWRYASICCCVAGSRWRPRSLGDANSVAPDGSSSYTQPHGFRTAAPPVRRPAAR